MSTMDNERKGWVQFTRRTENPKLQWLIDLLAERGIECVIDGESFHAPITWIKESDQDAAWEFLSPTLDALPDDDEMFRIMSEEDQLWIVSGRVHEDDDDTVMCIAIREGQSAATIFTNEMLEDIFLPGRD